jgi:hypothetical protein
LRLCAAAPKNTPVLLRQLRYFVAAAEAGQITEAANRLGGR